MQIRVTRGTDTKGMISKTQVFTLTVIVQPTEEEANLINQWGGGAKRVGTTITDFGDQAKPLYSVTFNDVWRGIKWEDPSLKRLLIMEEEVIKDCANVLHWCEEAATFGNNEDKVYEVTSEGVSP